MVQAPHGMGGVGTTQLAIEYAYRFAGGYDLVGWVNAEQPGLMGEQFTLLAGELGCADPGAGLAAAQQAVLGELRARDRWLLVFDNATGPDDVAGVLPSGAGHVLVTSPAQDWAEVAVPVQVDVLARAESVAILVHRVPGLGEPRGGPGGPGAGGPAAGTGAGRGVHGQHRHAHRRLSRAAGRPGGPDPARVHLYRRFRMSAPRNEAGPMGGLLRFASSSCVFQRTSLSG